MAETVMLEQNLFEYFRVRIDDARRAYNANITDEGALYLAQLLADRARADNDDTTLAELHAHACQSAPAEQASTWRKLGDRALYDLGYFPEKIEGRAVSRTYYEDMGSAAYARVDDVLKRWFADAFGPLFRELAAGFKGCVDLLDAVRDSHAGRDDLTEMYEEWLETGCDKLATKLRRRGLILPKRVVLDA